MDTLTVLVVDDEAPLRELVRGYLERDGFAVLTAADGPTALDFTLLATLAAHPGRVFTRAHLLERVWGTDMRRRRWRSRRSRRSWTTKATRWPARGTPAAPGAAPRDPAAGSLGPGASPAR